MLALTDGGRTVSVRRAHFEFWAERPGQDALVLALAELLEAGLVVRSAPGEYSRA